jgi:hypothetical protein
MKNQTIRLLVLLAGIAGLHACKKGDQASQVMEAIPTKAMVENYVPTKVTNTGGAFFKSIDTICGPYLKYTTKIGLLGYESWPVLDDGNLTISMFGDKNYFEKLRRSPYAWWANWNKRPYVEEEIPEIFSMRGTGTTTLTLSKKCYVFGFELSANPANEERPMFPYQVRYYGTNELPDNKSVGIIENSVTAPSGARMFAVESDIPFDRVEIRYIGTSSLKPDTWAITNLRYITDRNVYEAHKKG